MVVGDVEVADTRMIMVAQGQAGTEFPVAPESFTWRAGKKTLVGYDQQSFDKAKAGVEIDFDCSDNGLVGIKLRARFNLPCCGEIVE